MNERFELWTQCPSVLACDLWVCNTIVYKRDIFYSLLKCFTFTHSLVVGFTHSTVCGFLLWLVYTVRFCAFVGIKLDFYFLNLAHLLFLKLATKKLPSLTRYENRSRQIEICET